MSQLKNAPLRLILTIPFMLQILGAVGLAGWLSWQNSQRAVNQLAQKLQHEVSDRIYQHLDSYLQVPEMLNQLTTSAVYHEALPLDDITVLEHHFWRQIQVEESIQWIYLGTERGGFVGAGRGKEDSFTLEVTRDFVAGDFETYAATPDGDRGDRLSVDADYDPRIRPWYTVATETDEPVWSEIYSIFPEAILAISASQALRNQQGDLLGVVAADVTLVEFGNFLQRLDVLNTGQTFILERSGLLIASSTQEPPFMPPGNATDEPLRLHALESQNLLIQGTTQAILDQFQTLENISTAQNFQFELGEERGFAQVTPFNGIEGVDWLIVVVIPESNFNEQIRASTRNTLMICLVALLAAIAMGILTTRWITRPILQLSHVSEAIANGDFSQQVPPSVGEELRRLGDSFNRMSRQLQHSRQQLEDYSHNLEHKVQERTQELAEKNLRLQQTLQQLQQTQTQLIQTEKMSGLGQMVAGVAHEINNPISFIHGNLSYTHQYIRDLIHLLETYQHEYPDPSPKVKQTIQDIDLDFLVEDLQNILTSMQGGSDRIRNIVLSLRNFSRLDEAEMKPVNLHEGLENTLMILQHRLHAVGDRPEIVVEKSYGELPAVTCYASQLNQVFMNILGNAIDAIDERVRQLRTSAKSVENSCLHWSEDSCPSLPQSTTPSTLAAQPFRPFQPIIQITTEPVSDNAVQIRIRDNAGGMTEEVRSRLFDPFFTTKPVGKGTGLGLSISYQIVVERHNGKLTCESTLGKGSQLTIEIPITPSHILAGQPSHPDGTPIHPDPQA